MTIQQAYDAAPNVVQAMVRQVLGLGGRKVGSVDAGRPWRNSSR